jgi:protein-tyrosine phosphatase
MTMTGVPNLRDVARGGLQRGVLYRAASPHLATPGELAALATLGIGTFIDLRSDTERRALGDGGLTDLGIRTVHVPLIPDLHEQLADLPSDDWTQIDQRALYLTLLDRSASAIVDAITVIAEADTACLVTCTGGRDRTGIVVALTLAAAGAFRDDIVDDYIATNTDMARIIDRMNARGLPDGFPHNLAPVDDLGCDGAVIRAVLDHAEDQGGAAEFLLRHGLTRAALDRLRRRLGRRR